MMESTAIEQQQEPRQRRGRKRLNPFLKKPLWVVLEDCGQHSNVESSGNSNVTTSIHEDNDNVDGHSIELPTFDYNDHDESSLANEHSIASTQQQVYDHHHSPLPSRHLSLFDLVSIGVGGTIGSGIFVLNGLIANQYAGPATFISWIISGIAAMLSGCCYAELSGRIPSTGSSYAYAFVALGELPAFITAGMLTLEFLFSGSAVARSWGDKLVEWCVELNVNEKVLQILEPGYGINPAACLVSLSCSMLVLAGVKESKKVTDIFTWLKVCLVTFMTVGGFVLFNKDNLQPFIPPEFGASGILRGAVSSFFGFLGFDAVCVSILLIMCHSTKAYRLTMLQCVAGEAINAERNLPLSIMITLGTVTVLYVAAAISLVGMQNYQEISPESGFPEAFKANGIEWAAQLTAFGEVFTLPVVVLISIIIQPRLQFALANDGLLPPFFGEIDSNGLPRKGAIFAGVLMTIFATFIPFSYLDDFVSAGILVAFTTTNCSLVILRRESPTDNPYLLQKLLGSFNLCSFISCFALSHLPSPLNYIAGSIVGIISALIARKISHQCPSIPFGSSSTKTKSLYGDENKFFKTPLVPYIPCMGMFINYLLICQLSFLGIAILFGYIIFAILIYFLYGAHHSVGRNENWDEGEYAVVDAHDNSSHPSREEGVMT